MNFYIFFQILIVSLAATSAMTLFRYAIAAKHREIYKEPLLLTYLFAETKLNLSMDSKKILGWLLHFGIGFFFVLAYHLLWLYNILDLSVINSFLLGVISGIIGVFSLFIMFKIVKYTFSADYKGYYLQMFVAHIVFALYAAATYYILINLFLAAYPLI